MNQVCKPSAGSLVLNALWVDFEWDELGKFYRLFIAIRIQSYILLYPRVIAAECATQFLATLLDAKEIN